MPFFRRAVAHLGVGKDAIVNQLAKRQEGTSTSASASSSLSASPASRPSDSAAATSNSKISPTSFDAALTAATSATSPSAASEQTVVSTDFVSTPEFTATRTTAYTAPGVNATEVTHNTTSTYTASAYLATANASASGIPHNELTACEINGTLPDNGPFCSPIHLQDLWVGFTYAITWNPALFSGNASNTIVLRYDDGDQGVVWNSSVIPSGKGYMNINMHKEWLQGHAGNDSASGQNMTLYAQTNNQSAPAKGPTISLVVDPSTLAPVLIPKLPARLGLEIGLPIGVVAALIIILAIWCSMRKHQRSWRDVKGHGQDYMARRARRRKRAGKEGSIQLEDYNSSRGQDTFSDEPYIGGSGNAFRDEIAKQREEDDRYRPTVHSY